MLKGSTIGWGSRINLHASKMGGSQNTGIRSITDRDALQSVNSHPALIFVQT